MSMFAKAVEAAGSVAATMDEDVRHRITDGAIERIVEAVLDSIREPDMATRMNGRNAILGYQVSPYSDYSVAVGAGFTAMIDAILSEKPA